MNPRERILAWTTLGVVVLGLGYVLLNKLLLTPLNDLSAREAQLDIDISDFDTTIGKEKHYRQRLQNLMARTFGVDQDTARQNARAHLVRLVERSGLDSRNLTLLPITGKRINGGREVGWTLKVRGSLADATDLLYLLQADPQLARIENVTWSPLARSTDVELMLHFLTLVIEPPPGEQPAPIDPKKLVNNADLRSNDRKQYALISDRDLFRPYIRRPDPPPPPVAQQRNASPPQRDEQPSAPPPPPLKLVGLPDWGDGPEVNVRNEERGTLETYHVGDNLLGSEIMAIDYRMVQHPRNPLLFSPSRVILRSGRDFYAIEVGDMLAQKHKITLEQLPPAVRAEVESWMRPVPAPASQGAQSQGEEEKKTTPVLAPRQPDSVQPPAVGDEGDEPEDPNSSASAKPVAPAAGDDAAATPPVKATPDESKEIRDAS